MIQTTTTTSPATESNQNQLNDVNNNRLVFNNEYEEKAKQQNDKNTALEKMNTQTIADRGPSGFLDEQNLTELNLNITVKEDNTNS